MLIFLNVHYGKFQNRIEEKKKLNDLFMTISSEKIMIEDAETKVSYHFYLVLVIIQNGLTLLPLFSLNYLSI